MSVRKLAPLLVVLIVALSLLLLRPFSSSWAADDLTEGGQLYQIHCAGCHGAKGEGGKGTTLAVPKLSRATTEDELLSLIALGIPGTEMSRSRLDRNQVRQVALWVRKMGQAPPPSAVGDARRGEELYRAKGNCAACHAIRGQGGVAGPDLTEIGLRRGRAHLRQSLLEPDADIPDNFAQLRWHVVLPDNYLQVRVATKDGQRVTGVRLNEDTFTIQLRDAAGRVHSFAKAALTELHKDWGKSSMPSYREVFSTAELDDVLAFLISLRGEK